MGAGLSSSAALELAVCQALCTVYGLGLSREEMALASREAENEFVGMPCGILDQGVSAMGKSGSLVYIDCRKMLFSTIPLGRITVSGYLTPTRSTRLWNPCILKGTRSVLKQ